MNTLAEVRVLKKERLMWIDWMKGIGIYFIVAGHFFAVGHIFVYAFSVPLFFVVSGFLTKKESSTGLFWKKLCYNMLIPMALICTANILIDNAINWGGWMKIAKFPFLFILGFHKALKCLWFVYTLILLKLILQYTPQSKFIKIALLIVLPAIGVWIDAYPVFFGYNLVAEPNAILDVTIAYPFFICGYYLRRWKDLLINFNSTFAQLTALIVACAILLICGEINGYVWMYRNGYGHNFLLCLLNGFCGTFIVFIISKWLGNLFAKSIITISKGTIVILGFHFYFINLIFREFPHAMGIDYLYALLITVVFIPIICFMERYLPYMIGKYRA